MTKPLILVVPSFEQTNCPEKNIFAYLYLQETYINSLISVGLAPLVTSFLCEEKYVERITALASGILLAGNSYHINPALYEEDAHQPDGEIDYARYPFAKTLLKKALKLDMPTLGICHGIQEMNVFMGGSLEQQSDSQRAVKIEHVQKNDRRKPCHEVVLERGSKLFEIFGSEKIKVNSNHIQSIKKTGKGVRVVGKSPDGVIEAIEIEGQSFCIGVEWHPERLCLNETTKLFLAFAEECKKYQNRRLS